MDFLKLTLIENTHDTLKCTKSCNMKSREMKGSEMRCCRELTDGSKESMEEDRRSSFLEREKYERGLRELREQETLITYT